MLSEFSIRVGMCGKNNVDVVKEIKKKKIKVDASRFSKVINGVDDTPSGLHILEVAEEIVTAWEKEQGRVWDGKAFGFWKEARA